jgi:hypothetical protein
MKVYRIKNWNLHYENNRTRELKNTFWVPIPNKLDNDGYTLIMDQKNGACIFGAWIACVEVASRCEPRGTLLRDPDTPHDSASLSRITRVPVALINTMLKLCIEKCNWIEYIDLESNEVIPHDAAEISQDVAQNRKKEQKEYTRDSFEYKLSNIIYEQFAKPKGAKKPNIQTWCKQVSLMKSADGRTEDYIMATLESVKTYEGHNGFTWRSNIRSTKTMRDKMNEGKIYPDMKSAGESDGYAVRTFANDPSTFPRNK